LGFQHLESSLHGFQKSRFLRCPEGTLWVLRAIRLFKSSLPRLRPIRFFEWPECKKCFGMAFRHHLSLLPRHHLSRILSQSEGILLILRTIRLFKTSLKRLHSSSFYRCIEYIKWVRHLEISIHRLH
jgi:hypothetical protein